MPLAWSIPARSTTMDMNVRFLPLRRLSDRRIIDVVVEAMEARDDVERLERVERYERPLTREYAEKAV